MQVRIGVNPIAWSNDDLQDIGGDISLETCLSEAQSVGFEGIEIGHKFPRQSVELTAALAPYNLACIGGWHSIELLRRDAQTEFQLAAAHRALLKAMGTDVFIVAETSNSIHGQRSIPLSRRPTLPDTDWNAYGSRLTSFADLLAQEGFKLCYHHHMGTIVQSGADVDLLMRSSGKSVNLLLDTGHATWGGSDPAEMARKHKKRIAHVHTKDVRLDVMAVATENNWSFLDSVLGERNSLGVYTVPGDGAVDFNSVFRELTDYRGWVVIEAEQDPKKARPKDYAVIGYQTVRECLRATRLL